MAPSWAGHFGVELPLNFPYYQENETFLVQMEKQLILRFILAS